MIDLKWDRRFLHLAQHIAHWSKDPSTKCGAVIVRQDRTIASLGYNGFPRNTSDSSDLYSVREMKYSRVIHAEMNAILTCPERPKGLTLYTFSSGWGPACDRCAAHIAQSGIARIVFDIGDTPERAIYSINQAVMILREANIIIEGVEL